MRARSTSRTATCSRSTASPATTGGRTGRASPMASTGRSTGRTCRSPTIIGQSYRLTRKPGIFPDGTGLTDRFSDIVGRTRVRYRPADRPHPPLPRRQGQSRGPPQRDRPDRRHRPDLCRRSAICGSTATSTATVEDLRDKEELRLAGRVKFARYWSVFGATVLDLTDARKTRCRWPTASSRCGTGSASPMRTNASSLACRGGATMSASASSARAALSRFAWPEGAWPLRLRSAADLRLRGRRSTGFERQGICRVGVSD